MRAAWGAGVSRMSDWSIAASRSVSPQKKKSDRKRMQCRGLLLLVVLLPFWFACENQHMGSPMNGDSAKKWHQCGYHVRQKEPTPSAEVRHTTLEVVRAPPDTSSYVAGVERARGRAVRAYADRRAARAEQAACRVQRRRGGSRVAGKAALQTSVWSRGGVLLLRTLTLVFTRHACTLL